MIRAGAPAPYARAAQAHHLPVGAPVAAAKIVETMQWRASRSDDAAASALGPPSRTASARATRSSSPGGWAAARRARGEFPPACSDATGMADTQIRLRAVASGPITAVESE